MKKNIFRTLALLGTSAVLASCDPFIFGKVVKEEYDYIVPEEVETFDGTSNCIFFALYNYYGYEGQHFTHKWLGMHDALLRHGIEVKFTVGEKDARKMEAVYHKNSPEWDLPNDAKIFMVNNQTWNINLQYSKPITENKPMAVISTCNGVEFAASPILSSGLGISNATIGGFSDSYREAFTKGSLKYLATKYMAHILPIYAACVDAVDNGSALRSETGEAFQLSVKNWAVQTLTQYDELNAIDSIDSAHPTMRKINVDSFFDRSNPNGAKELAEFVSKSDPEDIKAMYELNGTNADEDTASYRTGKKLKCGIIAPSSVNDTVGAYIKFMKNYLATAYNVDTLDGTVSNTINQISATQTLINQGCDFIISLQDDTDRINAIKLANDKKVFFGIVGNCQNDLDHAKVKSLPYYVGSIGTSIYEEQRTADEMTEYYLQAMIKRDKGIKELVDWQCEVKGIENPNLNNEPDVLPEERKDARRYRYVGE
ncbi:MAG: hypothetical protein MJ248_02345 [Bacilli bacterium]|nr:hypothetical protein [Bacilli bacterium]